MGAENAQAVVVQRSDHVAAGDHVVHHVVGHQPNAACKERKRTPDMGRGAGMVRPDAPQRSPSMGCAACKEHEKTPDMGRGAGMVRPEAPKGHHLWGERHARGTKGPHLWGACPGWGGLKPPKVTIYGESVMPGARKVPIYGAHARVGEA